MKSNKGVKVVSLFDGIACGLVALKRAGIEVAEYHSFEIDKYAIQIAQKNHPEIIQHGSVIDFDFRIFKDVDLLIGGFPCQAFSNAGKQKGFNDSRGSLFFEVIRAKKEMQPKNFLLENVRMKKEFLDVINEQIGVEPLLINSSLVSAQNRQRNYWCNWKVEQPEDSGVLLKDILHEYTDCLKDKSQTILATLYKENAKSMIKRNKKGLLALEELSEYVVPFDKTIQILNEEVKKGKIKQLGENTKGHMVYYIHDNEVAIHDSEDKHPVFGCITPDRVEKRQNGQRFNTGQKFYTLTAQDKHGVLVEGYIRKLTPMECERLQTLEDGYTEGISKTQRYKVLGNGWTVDVIAHIFKQMNQYRS